MNSYPKKNDQDLSVKRQVSTISDKLVYLHPNENVHYTELNRCFYILEDIKERLLAIMPMINRVTEKESEKNNIHFEHDLQNYLSELLQIEKSVHTELAVLMKSDQEAFEHFSKNFLSLCFSINTSMKWQMYYIAGIHVKDLSFREEKNYITIKEKFHSKGLRFSSVNEIDDRQEAFNFHHIDKRYLWGTSYREMLINIHHRFHSLIHQVTDYPNANIIDDELIAMEEISKNVSTYQRNIQKNRTSMRNHICRIEKIMDSIHTHYGEGIFSMEEYLERVLNSEKKNDAFIKKRNFFIEHRDKLLNMRDKYILEILSRLIKSIPFFIENTREFNHYIDRYQYNEDLLKIKQHLEDSSELLKTTRLHNTDLNLQHDEIKKLVPKNTLGLSEDMIFYYKEEYANKIDDVLKRLIHLIKSTAHGAKKFPQLVLSTEDKREINKSDEVSIGTAQSRLALRDSVGGLITLLDILPIQEIRNKIYQPLLFLEHELKEAQKINDIHPPYKKNKKKKK